jgi:CBS domain-containing protein
MTLIHMVMTPKIITVPVGTSIQSAQEIMIEKRIRHLPVVDHSQKVIGMLSQSDMTYLAQTKNVNVEMIMSIPVQSIDENTPVRKAIFTLLEKKISSLLVTKADGKVAGIVTTDDLLWQLAHLLSEEEFDVSEDFSVREQQTIGEIANELSIAGI